jgi:hypothetical protein
MEKQAYQTCGEERKKSSEPPISPKRKLSVPSESEE